MPIQETMQDLSAIGGLPLYATITIFFLIIQQYQVFWQLVAAFIAVFGITIIARISHYRERPDKQRFLTWYQKIDASSFPSLHAGRAATLAIILANYMSKNYYGILGISILFGALLIAVCLTRVYLHRHYFTDVLFGAIVGIASALIAILTIHL